MEEKAKLVPPDILNLKDGDIVKKFTLSGTGEPDAVIALNSNFYHESNWDHVTTVQKDGSWIFEPEGIRYVSPKKAWVRARQIRHWPSETSEPSEKIFFTKVLNQPEIRKLESLPLIDQIIEGTGMFFDTQIEIELIKISPLPTGTYKTIVKPDGSGWWKATPKWALLPGEYVLKAMQRHTDYDNVEHVSDWSEDMPITAR
ncbi:MAG: hypothetical protein JWP42_4725 [Pseudomonas sp.]|nr:hypothetical protein [Pseudomonas sp.]